MTRTSAHRWWVPLLVLLLLPVTAGGATMYSTVDSYMGAGWFYGPGPIEDVPIFDVVIPNIGFATRLNFVTPHVNNGGAEPNICAEDELGTTPDGMLSDGVTRINESVDACSFELNGMRFLAAVVDGGPHGGRQVAVTLVDGTMIMTMDFALDMGIGKSGIVRLPFYGTTGEVTLPPSLQTQMGIEGGVDQAGSLKTGDKLEGRLGDYDGDGMLDGAIVVAGNMPLDSILLPGAPYALIRYFETDIPYDGKVLGQLPGEQPAADSGVPPFRVEPASGDAVAEPGAAGPATPSSP